MIEPRDTVLSSRLALRVLVADDEAPARAKVRRFLDRDPDVAVVFEARDGTATLSVIRHEAPDLVLLDIEMPGMSGLDVVSALPVETAPHVVFLTAYDTYAVRAFELAAVDYLLKPFDAERFAVAMTRAKRALHTAHQQENMSRLLTLLAAPADKPIEAGRYLDRLPVADGDHTVLVRVSDIERLEAADGAVQIHAGGQTRRARFTLAELEQRLDPARFARVGRGMIVNVDRVHAFEAVGHGDYVLIMRDKGRVRLSRRYVPSVSARLGF